MRTVSGATDRVVVVGAGLSGLSAALHLTGAGREVTVLDRAPRPGGRVATETIGGHAFDTGATVLTMPELLDEAFAAVGEKTADRLTLTRLDPAYRAHFADGSTLNLHTEPEAMEEELRAVVGPHEVAGYRRLRRWLTELYTAEAEHFIGGNFDSPFDLLRSDARPALARLVALGGFGRLWPKVAGLVTDDRVRRLFSFQALYAGLEPRRALGAYGAIPFMDTVGGVSYPEGGMGAIATAMAGAAEQAGATVRTGTQAAWLERVGDRVRAVRTSDGERIPCDAVVLATELAAAYRLLGIHPRRPVRPRYSPSAVVLHGETSRSWDALDHHTIFFGGAWHETFREIVRDGRLMSDPSLLVTRPTATDPTLASGGRQLVSVLAPAPNLRTGPLDWPRIAPAYRDELVRTLQDRGLDGFAGEFRLHRMDTPQDWAADGMAAGTPFSLAHTLAQTGPFRPGNLVRGAANVVLAGSGTRPGVGIPPVLISGRLAAQRITGAATSERP
ncbi:MULTISPECIES: phytoene desaturase family protein [Prauserella salsuginis group]|uniref:Phytoene desaturase n=2 Tax=Prauserella salsuginis group TaxID=2893672 RepID=A0A839XFG0_9PSEU|nr:MULTISPECIES: phytoene desaturase family protein [Prauserella salsuginis group]MBB3661157.1 phytoene desaturase [Prauserella sediminis]MCR3719020.1 phytoene desaturase [Prauserella flava]MCR3733590.1 phytoene desaturase [Prauserella salsuginis]